MSLRPSPTPWPQPIPWKRFVTERRPALLSIGTAVGVVGFLFGAATTWALLQPPQCGGGNETATVATLRNISSSQLQFQAGRTVDADGDGVGEFGGFLEMSGAIPLRGSTAFLRPPVLSGAFRTVNASGEVRRSGYLFRMWLIGADGVPVGESAGTGFSAASLDPDQAELHWVCYAWPATADSGVHTFAVDWCGNIVSTTSRVYCGTLSPPPDAAFGASGFRWSDRARFDGGPASDGNVWRLVN